MNQRLLGKIVVVLLFGLALAAVFWVQRDYGVPMLDADDEHWLVADLDFWQRTDRERRVATRYPLDLTHKLDDVPLTLGNWQGQDVPETNLEVFILLEPEQFVQRYYVNDKGDYLWLTLIGGRQSRSFHPVDLCYTADGWHTALGSRAIPLADGELVGWWLSANKPAPDTGELTEHQVFYFYVFPDRTRQQSDGIVLVRLTSPRYGTEAETLEIQSDFLRQLFQRATDPNSL